MGCYGIGVSRTLQAAIEQSFDANGIIWPAAVAPFSVEVLPINLAHAETAKVTNERVAGLEAAGVDVLVDDRDERPGVKFKDADLIGIPLRVTIGEKTLAKGQIEIKLRRTGELRAVPTADVLPAVQAWLAELRTPA